MIYSDNEILDEEQKQKVLAKVRERDVSCGHCGSDDFEVGEALPLGFLFLTEKQGMYMVALTCKREDCATPRMGIKLHEPEFLGT